MGRMDNDLALATPQGSLHLPDSARVRLYETVLGATPDLIYVFDRRHRFIYANEALLAMWGLSWDEAMGKTCLEIGYEPWHAAMHDEEIERVVATRAPVRGDVPFPHQTQGVRIYDYIFMPVIGPDGEVEAIAGTTRDVTERKRNEDALRGSEQRFSAIVLSSSDLIYRTNATWDELEILGGRAVAGLPRGASSNWLEDFVHPDDRARVADAVQRACQAEVPYAVEHRLAVGDGDDGWVWVDSRAVPIRDATGQVVEWFGAATDVTERVRHAQHQQLLVNELNHRVKNTLAVVQSMVQQTLRNTPDAVAAAERIDARLVALAQAHDTLTRKQWQGATVEELVRTAIAPCLDGDASRFSIEGPTASLDPRRAVALAMALHELCTNAMKYGALSTPGGNVQIHWQAEDHADARQLRLAWRERGGPPVAPPTHRGFGSRLIERGLRYDLGGDVRFDFAPTGVECTITAPLPPART